MIKMIDHYTTTPEKIVKDLEDLLVILGENEDHIFRCTCEEHDPPRGSYSYDDNSYDHHRDCLSGSAYHYDVLLRGLARYFNEDYKEEPAA